MSKENSANFIDSENAQFQEKVSTRARTLLNFNILFGLIAIASPVYMKEHSQDTVLLGTGAIIASKIILDGIIEPEDLSPQSPTPNSKDLVRRIL